MLFIFLFHKVENLMHVISIIGIFYFKYMYI